jgi:disulfide bond formation protein DsbB
MLNRALSLLSCHLPWVILGAAIFSLAFAYTMQYGFGFQPCILCLYQRPPYFVLIGLVVIILIGRAIPAKAGIHGYMGPGVRRGSDWVCLWLCALSFAIGGAIGAYQVGVEYHWWAGPSGCSGGSLSGLTASEILARIEAAATVRCDEVQFRFLGLSMAAMNALWSFALAGAVATGLVWGPNSQGLESAAENPGLGHRGEQPHHSGHDTVENDGFG